MNLEADKINMRKMKERRKMRLKNILFNLILVEQI